MQADILDHCPDDGQATHLGREHVNLIGALAHIAEQTFDGIGRLNVAVHALREPVKRQEVLFVLSQASHRLGIALTVFGFEGGQLGYGLLFCGLLPDPHELGSYLSACSSGNGVQDIPLFKPQTALPGGGRKQF